MTHNVLKPVGSVSEIIVSYQKKTLNEQVYKAERHLANLFLRMWPSDIAFRERMYAAYFNNQLECVAVYEVSVGSAGTTSFDPYHIIQMAYLTNTKRFAIAHNHPSGLLKASQSDINVTKTLKNHANYLSMELLEHLIVTEESYTVV